MVPWSARGDILRWWRADILGLSQQQAADRLAVQPSALSNWEHGTRAISIDVDAIDDSLHGKGVLAGLLWAFGTVDGLDPSPRWTHVFAGHSGPVWLWLRADSDKVRFRGEWGVARVEAEVDLGPNGVFVGVGAAVSESPIIVTVSEPAWVDFGLGPLPKRIPGADVLSAVDLFEKSSASGAFMELFISNLATRLSGPKTSDTDALAGLSPKAVASFLSGHGIPGDTEAAGPLAPIDGVDDEADRLPFARLRRARGMSLADAVAALVKRADIGISKETLRRFETDVGHPHDRLLPAALDEVLGGAGHLAQTTIRSDTGHGLVSYPPFWHGPVWLEFDGPSVERIVQLEWGPWNRRIRIIPPVLLTFTCSMPEVPVRIKADNDIRWATGLGKRIDAQPIDHNWDPASVTAAQRALSDTESALLRALQSDDPDSSP